MLGKRALVFLLLSVVLIVFFTATAATQPVSTDPAVLKAIAEARQAIAKYSDVSIALGDGYLPASMCEENMGMHYVNFALALDLTVSELMPDMLLYVPIENGFRLVGVEYFGVAQGMVPLGSPGPLYTLTQPDGWVWVTTPPTVFGQTMGEPMHPHGPGMPWHYDLHVWLWESNPDGIFTPYNPNVSCD